MKLNKKIIGLLSLIILIILCAFITEKVILQVEEQEKKITNNNEMIIHYIDVSQGDSTFIELPNNETMLIDAGEEEKEDVVINYIKELGYDNIDYVIGTHPHSDHIGGLEAVINSFTIGTIYMPKVSSTSKIYEDLLKTIKSKNMTVKKAYEDVVILDNEELNISFLSPMQDEYTDINNYSAVLKIIYGNNSFLFMGDATEEVENKLTNISCDVLKVGHHGSNTSSSSNFVRSANPKYAIISVGKDNKYGHPSDKVIERYISNNTEVLRTDLLGTIKVISNGNEISVDKEENVIEENNYNFSLVSFTDTVEQGAKASIEIKGEPNTLYSISLYYKSGKSKASGLEDKLSDEEGIVRFEWTVGTQVSSGTYNAIISDGINSEEYKLTVKEKDYGSNS